VRVFLYPTGLHSRAMVRVANALTQCAPYGIETAPTTPTSCDLQILHVINQDAISYAREIKARGGKYAVIQYCFRTAGGELRDWLEMWRGAEVVWTYLWDVKTLIERYPCGYGPEGSMGAHVIQLYYSPLGVDEKFRACGRLLNLPGYWPTRRNRIITTGYVSGPGAEPIEETWRAADLAGLKVVHIGPKKIEGTSYRPAHLTSYEGVSDTMLAELYATSTWVSGLRHVEGFELPAAEGLVCGARPLVFDQPGMREWYGGHAVFIEEGGTEKRSTLVQRIAQAFESTLPDVTYAERERALAQFNWETIAKGFWEALLG